jgi:hypothetical protein
MKKAVIAMKIDKFNYFLRFDEAGEGWAEGLIQNATIMTADESNAAIANLESFWPISLKEVGGEETL